mmetsp:Transcript_56873/g.144204  ORF Transcript_56873/g.144204 Transcript_56873/m.144204 type:complete len:261 (-) Transcript_56873:44-826(-)
MFLFGGCTPQLQRCGCESIERAPGAAGSEGASSSASGSGGGAGSCCNVAPSEEGPGDGKVATATLHCESQVPCAPPSRTGSHGPKLTVPSVFSRFQFSVIYTQLGATQGTLMEQQRSMLQAILKHFTKELSHGYVIMSVLNSDGRNAEYACSLDKGMTRILMQPVAGPAAAAPADTGAGGPGRGVKALVFAEIERICSPEEVRNLRAPNLMVLDECSTTVVLSGQRFVTIRLESVLAREYLMLCLQVLRMSQDKARMWYP